MKQLYTKVAGLISPATTFLSRTLALLVVLAGLTVIQGRAQAPAWQALQAVGGQGRIITTALATDGSGDVYVAGLFDTTLSLGGTTLTTHGLRDAYVAKWNRASSTFRWVVQLGGTGYDGISDLAVQGSTIYAAGTFAATPTFGTILLPNSGVDDVYVTKLTDTGTSASVTWVQTLGGTDTDNVFAMTATATGIYVAGSFSSAQLRGDNTIITNTNAGTPDVFVGRLNDAGSSASVAWLQQAGGVANDEAYTLAVQGSSVYVGGGFSSKPATFGGTVLAAGLTGNDFNMFVSKLEDTGTAGRFVWTKELAGALSDNTFALAANGPNVYVAVNSSSPTVTLDATTLTNNAPNGNNTIILKLIDSGASSSLGWAQQAQGSGERYCFALATNGTGVYLAGNFSGTTATFGTTTFTSPTASDSDIYVAKLTDNGPTGSWTWAQRAGGTAYEAANSLVLTPGLLYVGGFTASPTATFGSLIISTPTGSQSGFLAVITDPTLTAATPALRPGTLALHPNPARGTTTISLPASASPLALEVLDALGRTVRSTVLAEAVAGSAYPLDLTGLAPGLYVVRLSGGGTQLTRRLVVE